MIRGLRPTDVVAYIVFRNKVGGSNEAILWPNGRRSLLSIQSFIGRSLSLDPSRETWVKVGEGGIGGLAAAKARWGAAIWDVDQLVTLPAPDSEVTYVHLLQHLSASAGRLNVHKVFLRLESSSDALGAARQAGFFHYATEHIYRLGGQARDSRLCDAGLRPRKRADQQALFQLYCASTPASVRQVEGMTLQEWRWTDGWNSQPVTWQGGIRSGRRDYVCVQGSSLVAAIRADSPSRTLMIASHPEWQSKALPLIKAALSILPSEGSIHFAVRDYQAGLRLALEDFGGEHLASHALLARVLTARVLERTLMPLRA